MSRRLHAFGVDGGEGSEVVEDRGELFAQPVDLIVVETDTGKESDMLHVFLGKAHAPEDTADVLYRIATGNVKAMLHSQGMSRSALDAPEPAERRETR